MTTVLPAGSEPLDGTSERASQREGLAWRTPMSIAVVGAGAVGCYYGGMLARAGHRVTLVGREPHVSAMNRTGLLLDTQTFQARVAVQASTAPDAMANARLVLVCVKSPDTEAAGRAMAPFLAEGAVVLSLQNGVDNAQRLSAVLGREVLPAVVYVATAMAGPGHVRHHGRGELVIGPGAHSAALVALLAQAGVPVQVSDNVAGTLWAKLIVNCACNAVSAIAQQPYGVLARQASVLAVMRDAVDECVAVAQASGIVVQGDAWAMVQGILETMPAQTSSTAQDLARGRRTEIAHLNGYVVQQGGRLGIRTPVNQTLLALVTLLEAHQVAG